LYPFFSIDIGSEEEVLSEFTCTSYQSNSYFKQCNALEHKQSYELIIMKELLLENAAILDKHLAKLEKRKNKLTT
jgi:hypothetical protein